MFALRSIDLRPLFLSRPYVTSVSRPESTRACLERPREVRLELRDSI